MKHGENMENQTTENSAAIVPATETTAVAERTFYDMSPADQMAKGVEIANVLNDVIEKKQLYKNMGGRKYVQIEGWQICGLFFGVTPKEKEVRRLNDGSYEARVELLKVKTGMVMGGGSALCSKQERNWSNRDEYARRSMAITRATGKAYRIAFSWVMALAGYEPTPVEEMPDTQPQPQPPQQTAPAASIYTGTTEQQEVVQQRCKKNSVPEERWEDVHNKLMNKPSTELMAIIEEVKSDCKKDEGKSE